MGRTDSGHLSFSAGSGWSRSLAPRRKKARMGPFRNIAPGDGEIWRIQFRDGAAGIWQPRSQPRVIDVRLAAIAPKGAASVRTQFWHSSKEGGQLSQPPFMRAR